VGKEEVAREDHHPGEEGTVHTFGDVSVSATPFHMSSYRKAAEEGETIRRSRSRPLDAR